MTILNKDTLAIIMVGTTHVIDMGGKSAFLHYENADSAHMLLPDGTRFHGVWTLLDDGYKVDWTDGPSGAWKLHHTPGAIDYVDATGATRGRISRIDFGDSARLAV
ncbi:hypothetical protein [Mesorhizobium sp.]|uniref:hypothetical protein n=1 Tax=Mesorhizobium sp. TaxID=1871066 RepID=UPI000FE2DA4B|nr:hypothetical protein [Mesorhizobium sp.]RWK07476.1 MAG: hypothetical protein EOR42_08460 [Mesorhizobium sp.]